MLVNWTGNADWTTGLLLFVLVVAVVMHFHLVLTVSREKMSLGGLGRYWDQKTHSCAAGPANASDTFVNRMDLPVTAYQQPNPDVLQMQNSLGVGNYSGPFSTLSAN